MKKILKKLIIIPIVLLLTISLFATDSKKSIYIYEHDDFTFTFTNTQFDEFEREKIVNFMITHEQTSTRNIICDLLGHNMGSSETMTATSHRVSSTAPRCLKQTYSISTCSRCGHISSTLIGSFSMNCCS